MSGGQGFQKVSIFTPKGTCVRESTSFEPFLRQNRSRGVISRSVGEKSQKVTETPIGKTCRL